MTVVSSVETLTELPEGEQITVRSRQLGNQRWTKDASGAFRRDEALVGVEFFVGYVADGRVVKVDASPAGPGDWLTARRYDYFLIGHTETAGSFEVMTFYDGRWRNDNVYRAEQLDPERGANMSRVERAPDRVLQNPESVVRIMERYNDMLTVTRNQLETAREKANKPPPPPPEPVRETVVIRVSGVDVTVDSDEPDSELPQF